MKTFLILLLLLGLSLTVHAGTVTLAWDRESDTNVAGYYLYGYTNAPTSPTNFSPCQIVIDCRTNCIASLSTTNVGCWWFGVTAYSQAGVESALSDTVTCYFPPAPTGMVVMVPQWSATLGSTNWMDLGFFRLKIGMP